MHSDTPRAAMRRTGISMALAALALAMPAWAQTFPITFTSCAHANPAPFAPTTLLASNTSVAAGQLIEFSLAGTFSEQVTAGAFMMLTASARSDGDMALSEQFGKISDLLTNTWPLQSPLTFSWMLPADTALTSADSSMSLQLQMNDQTQSQLLCIQATMPITVPPPPPTPPASTSKSLGYLCAMISVLFFGTNFLPVKAYDTGDGVFFQWMLCLGVWCCGLVVQLVRQSAFEPLAMLGGMMWCIGNMTSVPVIQLIGLGVGMCIWGTAGLIMGWASGRFGLLGIHSQKVDNQVMNVFGLLLCVCSMGLMFQVKSMKAEDAPKPKAANKASLLDADQLAHVNVPDGDLYEDSIKHEHYAMKKRVSYDSAGDSSDDTDAKAASEVKWVDKLPPASRRILGITLAIMAGCLYGLNFNPPQYLIDSGRGASSHGIDYVFSHFCGILTTSTVYMIAYSCYRRNQPQVISNIVLPGMASGMGWGIAQISWFVANDQIHFVGTFPIVSCGPGIVATLCAIVFYKEIQGTRNYLILMCAAVCTGIGVVLIAFSLPSGSGHTAKRSAATQPKRNHSKTAAATDKQRTSARQRTPHSERRERSSARATSAQQQQAARREEHIADHHMMQHGYPSSQQQQQLQQPAGPGALLDSSGASRAAAQAERERELWNNVAMRQQQQQMQQQGQKPPMHSYNDRGMQQQQQQQPPPQQPHASQQHWSPSPNLLSMRPSSVNTTVGSSGGNSSAPSSASPMSRLSDYGRSEDGGDSYGRGRQQMGTSPGGEYRSVLAQPMQNNNNNGGYQPQQQQQQQQQLSPSFSAHGQQQPGSPSPSPSPDPFNSRASDPARIQALVQVIHQLHEAGVSAKFLSQLGILYKQLHPTLFVKGQLKELVDNAAASGLLILSGPPGQQQVELTAQGQAIAKQWGRTHQLQNMHQLLEVRAFMVDAVVSEREARERENAANAANANASQRAPPLSASPGAQQWTVNAGVSSSHNSSLPPLTQSFHSSSALSTQHSSPRHLDSQQSGQFSFLIEGDDSLDAHAPHLAQHRSAGLLGLSSTRPSHLRDDSRDDHSDLGLGVTDEEDSQLLNSYSEVEMLRDMRDLYKNNSTGVPVSSSNQQHGMHSHSYSTTHSQATSSQSSLVSSMQSSPHTSPNGGALLYHSHQTNGQKPPLIFHSQPQPLNNNNNNNNQQQQQQGGPQRTSPSYNAVGNQGYNQQFDNSAGSSQLTAQAPPTSGDLSALQLLPPLPTGLEEKTFRGEKLKHLKYIFHFRVHPCLNFLQRGSCPFDNKNECFDYHSLKTRRRIPRIYNFSNGIFWNYNACRCQSIEKDMRCEKGEACRYAHCFEDSTQILTEQGFMFRHELAAADGSAAGMPLIATYNRVSQQVEYQQAQLQSDGTRLYTVPASMGPFDMVEFGSPSDRTFWSGQSESQVAQSERSHHAELLVSDGHTMWASRGAHTAENAFATTTAADLFLNTREAARMQSMVPNGLAEADLQELCDELQLAPAQIGAMCELYGYFLGDGFMRYHASGPRIGFYPRTSVDKERLVALFAEAGLSGADIWLSGEHASGRPALHICKASWAQYFDQHYGRKYTGGAAAPQTATSPDDDAEEIKSAKWLLWWARRRLGKALARRLIAGLRLADGDDANVARVGEDGCAVIYTSSACFRDEVMQLMVHAGFSAVFHMHDDVGAHRGVVAGKAVIANVPNWRIEYNETLGSGSFGAQPVFHPAKDMEKRKHNGPLWCVTVPNGLIIARRAKVEEVKGGVQVVAASRAVVVGNCKEEIAYHPSRYKTAACSYPLRSDGSCSRFGLHCFGDDTRILTSQGFLFREEMEARLAAGDQLSYACYDAKSKTIVYGAGVYSRYANPEGTLVNFTAEADQLSVRVTSGHEMFLQSGIDGKECSEASEKMRADATLIDSCDCSERSGESCDRCRSFVRFTAVAAGGVSPAHTLVELARQLGLDTAAKLDAFLEVYGFWLRHGIAQHDDAIAFHLRHEEQLAWLTTMLARGGVPASAVSIAGLSLRVASPSWFASFVPSSSSAAPSSARAVSGLSQEEGKDTRALAEWVLQRCDASQIRRIIQGMQHDEEMGTIRVSSVCARDDLMVACLHAGYTARFARAGVSAWSVHYADPRSSAAASSVSHPVLRRQSIVKEKYDGIVWCVTVDHPDHLIIVQRGVKDASGVVTDASRPVVIGNCAFSHGEHDIRKAIVLKQGMPHKLVEPAMHVLQEQQKLVAALTGLTLAELNGFSLSGHNNSMAFGPGSANSNISGNNSGHNGINDNMHRGHIPSGMHASSSNNGLSAWEQQLQQRNALHNVQTNGLAGSSSSTHLMLQSGDSMQQQQQQQHSQYMDQRPGLGRPNSVPSQGAGQSGGGGGPNSNLSLSMSVVNSGGSGGDLPYGTAPNSPTGGPSSSVNLDPSYLSSLDPALYMCPPSELAADREHFLYSYKTQPCRNQTLACAKGDCQSYHFETKRRRNPRIFKYSYEACPAVKVPTEMSGAASSWRRPSACRLGDACSLAHTRLEVMYHPLRWKHTLCEHFDERDRSTWQRCPWKRACAHAHSRLELDFAEASAMHDQGHASKAAGPHDFHDEHLGGISGPPPMGNSPHFGRVQQGSYTGSSSGAAHELDDSLPGVPAHLSALSREFVPGTDVSDDSMRSVLLRQEVAAQILRAQSGQLHPSSTAAGPVSPSGSSTQSQMDALRTENLALADRCARYEKEFYLFKIHIVEKDNQIKKMQWTLDSELEEKRRLKAQLDTFKHELTQRFLQLTPQQQQQAIDQKPSSSSSAAPLLSGSHSPPGGLSPHDLSKGDHTAVSLAESVLVSPNEEQHSPAHAADPHSPKSPSAAKPEGAPNAAASS